MYVIRENYKFSNFELPSLWLKYQEAKTKEV